MQSKQYQALELNSVLKIFSSQNFSGVFYVETQNTAWASQRSCVLVSRNGEIVYAGLTIPNNFELAEMLGKKFRPGLVNAALQAASDKLNNPESFREILELFIKVRVFSWEQIEKLVYKKIVLHIDRLWQHSGIIKWETTTRFDLSYGEARRGFPWSLLQQELNRRQQMWNELSGFIPSMDAVPCVSTNIDQISDPEVCQHLQRYVDGNRSLLTIAEQLDKDPLAIARTYAKWAKLDWLRFDGCPINLSTLNNSELEERESASLPLVLSVDDSPIVQKSIERALNGYYKVILADNAIDALAILDRQPIKLVLLDLTMPDIDGLKFCATVRKIPKFRELPIVMVTARDGLIDKMKGRMAGTDKYLTKPFKPEELREVVNKYIKTGVT